MEALRETTGGQFPAHIYLLDGNKLVSYIKAGESEAYTFKAPIKGFDKRGRKFESVQPNPFHVAVQSNIITVKGSNGKEYQVDSEANTCTCPGFTFRGACKHLGVND